MDFRAAVTLFSMLAPSLACSQGLTAAELMFNDYYAKIREVDESEGRAASLRAAELFDSYYSALSTRQGMERASPEALHFLIRASSAKNFYTQHSSDLVTMRLAIERLSSLGKDNRVDWDGYFRSLILMRRFEVAEEVRRANPGWFSALPTINRNHEPADEQVKLWEVDSSSGSLVLTSKNISQGTYLVVIAHPACKFSRAAMLAFESDPGLQAVSTLWLVPPERDLSFDLISEWNAAHPGVQLLLADEVSQWKFENWSTPSFYLLEGGRILRERQGWALDGSDKESLFKFINGELRSTGSSTDIVK
jgi:hypothetical protein